MVIALIFISTIWLCLNGNVATAQFPRPICRLCKPNCQDVPKHYDEMACEPVKSRFGQCPIRFDCPEVPCDSCVIAGKHYAPGESINIGCGHCFCDDDANVVCAAVDCPETPPDCVKFQSLESNCCPEYICDEDEISKRATCWMNNESYDGGTLMYERDFRCLCDHGFDNSTAPEHNKLCRRIECGIELYGYSQLLDGCVPIYYESVTKCPFGWRCPKSSDSVVKNSEETDIEDQCSFGDLTLNVGDELGPMADDLGNKKEMQCSCSLPPMVTCLQQNP